MQYKNKVFRTKDNVVFTRIAEPEVADFSGNYITVIKDKAVAVVDGVEVPMPEILINECGVEYHFVENFYEFGKKIARKNGLWKAHKQTPVRVFPNVQPGEKVTTVIDGFVEHEVDLQEGFVVIQNIKKGEFYTIHKDEQARKYTFSHKEFDFEVWLPKAETISDWAYSDLNVFGALWGGFEFIVTPMINISNPEDSYACNYYEWWGTDELIPGYKVVGFFRACGTKFYEPPCGEPVKVADANFEPPKVLVAC